jgi:ParB family chromosome partitioning protein
MIDYTIYNSNLIRPSSKLNSIILKIYKNNLTNYTPEYIATRLGCTVDMVQKGIEFIRFRHVKSLNESLHMDSSEETQLIDKIESDGDCDALFEVEVMKTLSPIEQEIVHMLIDSYSTRDILRHYKISKYRLNIILQKIAHICGYTSTAIFNGDEGWLMNLGEFEMNEDDVENTEHGNLKWVALKCVLPNPKNPRKDLAIRTSDLQNAIEDHGWEVPITCYKSGKNYIILSGHRRWYAAKTLNKAMIPIFIVEAPKNEAEELDRIGSVQGGQVEWSPFDMLKYTYDRWIASGKISFHDLGNELGLSKGLVGSRIRVYQYYPKAEIMDKLNNHMYSTTMLDYIYAWIKRLMKYHPDVVESLGEHYIRRLMLKKYENRCFNSKIANDKTFVRLATSQVILDFLTDPNKKLEVCLSEIMYSNNSEVNFSSIAAELVSFHVSTKDEAKELLLEYEDLLACVGQKKRQLEKKLISEG